MAVKVTFLGTGTSQGVPVILCECEVCRSLDSRDKRLRTSIHIEVDGKSFVIDSGPDFRQQMLRERVERLDALIFTHAHKDHTGGMDDIRAFNYRQKEDIPIYGHQRVIDQLKQEFAYVFAAQKYPGVPGVLAHEIDNKAFTIKGIQFTPIEVLHHKLPVFGFRVEDFTYITDANFISETEFEKIKGTNTLVINALHKKKHLSHFNLEQALAIIEKINPQKAYLIHLSHTMGTHRKVSLELPKNVEIAYDGLRISIG
jgi:phosphoribosyl 1,2-cyclic phosphate phosphodiesterase